MMLTQSRVPVDIYVDNDREATPALPGVPRAEDLITLKGGAVYMVIRIEWRACDVDWTPPIAHCERVSS